MVEETSSGMTKMMRSEKYQAVSTASVTSTGWRIQFEYLQRTGLKIDPSLETINTIAPPQKEGGGHEGHQEVEDEYRASHVGPALGRRAPA
jgi:hypothetical protein